MARRFIPVIKRESLLSISPRVQAMAAETRFYDFEFEDELDIKFLRNSFDKLFKKLTPTQRDVIQLLYGFKTGKKDTQDYNINRIAQMYGVSPQRVKQIHRKALEKLKAIMSSKRLKSKLHTFIRL